MAHEWADGSVEQRPRTPEEIAAIEQENRIAAKSCWRQEDRRKEDVVFCFDISGQPIYVRNGNISAFNQRQGQNRTILSTFERDMLLGGGDE